MKINAIIVLKSKSREDIVASSNIWILPYFQLSKHLKHHYINTMFFQKWGKFIAKIIAKVENILDINNRSQTTLSKYVLTIPVVWKLNELQNWNKWRKIIWKKI